MPIAALAQGNDELPGKMNRYAELHNKFTDDCRDFMRIINHEPEYPYALAKDMVKRKHAMDKACPIRENGWPK